MYFYLFMIVNIFSRKVFDWEVHPMERASFAAKL